LEKWSAENQNIKVAITITKPEESKLSWKGITGRIDENMLKRLSKDWKLELHSTTFWICGPPPMVEAMEKLVGLLGITSDKVRVEKFTGY